MRVKLVSKYQEPVRALGPRSESEVTQLCPTLCEPMGL